MSIFGRVHECKEYEYQSEKKVNSEFNEVNSIEEKKDP